MPHFNGKHIDNSLTETELSCHLKGLANAVKDDPAVIFPAFPCFYDRDTSASNASGGFSRLTNSVPLCAVSILSGAIIAIPMFFASDFMSS
jgi:hypothetical protein